MAKKRLPQAEKKNIKTDPLVGREFTFTRDGKEHFGTVEARVSQTSYLVSLKPDGYSYVLPVSNMTKLDVVFEPKGK